MTNKPLSPWWFLAVDSPPPPLLPGFPDKLASQLVAFLAQQVYQSTTSWAASPTIHSYHDMLVSIKKVHITAHFLFSHGFLPTSLMRNLPTWSIHNLCHLWEITIKVKCSLQPSHPIPALGMQLKFNYTDSVRSLIDRVISLLHKGQGHFNVIPVFKNCSLF